jgi:hypothetical protein
MAEVSRVGPKLGVALFDSSDEEIDFMFVQGKNRVTFPSPSLVRVKKEGGSYHMLEFFYPPGQGPRALESYDTKTFILVTNTPVKEGKKTTIKKHGAAYGQLVCVGKLRETLEGYPNIRFDKFVCQTEGLNDWNDSALSLNGLAAPIETT